FNSSYSAVAGDKQNGLYNHGPVESIPTELVLVRAPRGKLGRDGGLDQSLDRRARGGCRTATILVHARRDCSAVIQQQEPPSQLFRIGRAGIPGKVCEDRPEPRAVLLGHDVARVPWTRLRGRQDKAASAEVRPFQQLLDLAEDAEDSLGWRVVTLENAT